MANRQVSRLRCPGTRSLSETCLTCDNVDVPFQIDLPTALRKAGVAVKLHDDWERRGHPGFDPRGVVCHHTAIDSDNASLRICTSGRSDLPGPLANVVLGKDGVAHVIAAGRANHAGKGGWQGLYANSQVWGIEAVHIGDRLREWPLVQVEAYEKVCAGMAQLSGFDPEMICGHKEWAPLRKIDPARIDMPAFRIRVAARLAGVIVDPARKVAPMYDPPLGPIAGVLQDEDGRVLAAVAPNGDVYCWGIPYLGGPSGKEYFVGRRAAQIVPAPGEMEGYVVVATSGERYGPSFG